MFIGEFLKCKGELKGVMCLLDVIKDIMVLCSYYGNFIDWELIFGFKKIKEDGIIYLFYDICIFMLLFM